ncbi:MAG: glutamate racemase [Bacteroidota bacterium]
MRIGIFDSGVGGLSIWQAVRGRLPQSSLVYLADQAYCPYGERNPAWIRDRSHRITEYLIQEYGCSLIVIACNTATSAAIHHLRDIFDIPFVGVEPAIKPAALQTKTGKVGVLATVGTLTGGHFLQTSERYASGVEVIVQIGHGLVEWVESGDMEDEDGKALLQSYLQPMMETSVDQLVLGCTHYPFLATAIEEITQGSLQIHEPSAAIATRVKELWAKGDSPEREELFLTTGEERSYERLVADLLGIGEIPSGSIQLF